MIFRVAIAVASDLRFEVAAIWVTKVLKHLGSYFVQSFVHIFALYVGGGGHWRISDKRTSKRIVNPAKNANKLPPNLQISRVLNKWTFPLSSSGNHNHRHGEARVFSGWGQGKGGHSQETRRRERSTQLRCAIISLSLVNSIY